VKAGDRVRIRPKKRADVMDMALAGKIALIEAVEQDSKAGCNSFSCSTMTLVAISACCGCQARKMTCSF